NRQNPVVCLFPWSGEDWRKSQTDFTDLQVSCEFCVAGYILSFGCVSSSQIGLFVALLHNCLYDLFLGRDAHVGFAVKNNGIPAIQKSSFLEAILEV
ncbi:unnamed protein product, partial [Linum tenue]